MITFIVLLALASVVLVSAFAQVKTFDLSNVGPVNTGMVNEEAAPAAVLEQQLSRGDINRVVYEMLVAEKLGLKLS
jgi:hypothetical protein